MRTKEVNQTYYEFLEAKKHTENNFGIKLTYESPDLFDFQLYVLEYLVKKGRAACFLDTGLGKTLIELCTAVNYIRYTNKPVLILTPLAVAFQFLDQAEKFKIPESISYSKDGKIKTKIVICNYERLEKFNPTDFDCVICDESSILKNFDGTIKHQVTTFLKKVKYRFLFTATPSPNDFIELGTSSEALGYMGFTDMLTKFFTNNEDTISPMNIGTQWLLKGHAKESFFKWVSGWSISMRKPSDLGFDDSRFILPELITKYHELKINTSTNELFPRTALRMSDIKDEQKKTIIERCQKAIELTEKHKTSVYWCNFNAEGHYLQEIDKTAYQIHGGMNLDKKEELLLAFSRGEINRLITKAKMTAFGLNWQHCNHTTYFPTWSYEQYYQAIRRFWRFGQTKPVTVDFIYTQGAKRTLDSILLKTKKANDLFDKLNANINKSFDMKEKGFDQTIKLPKFIK
jgi:hypothetical protein